MKLKNTYGNVIINTTNARKIARLKEQGYTEIKEKPIKAESKEKTVEKKVRKNENKKET